MKLNSFCSKRHSYTAIIIAVSILFFNCSELYISSWNCIEDGEHQCGQYGDIELLSKKSVDIVVVMDNSTKGQELNSQITSNLNRFLKCIEEVVDWQIGVVSSVEDKNSIDNLGQLIDLELKGEISIKKIISSDIKNYEMVFSDTISMESGCSYPPYCNNGNNKPLSAVKSFIHKEVYKDQFSSFLRNYASLAVIVISPSDEEDGMLSSSSTSAQDALASVYEHYDKDQFIGLTVTDSGTENDCIHTVRDTISKGVRTIETAATIYGLIMMNPLITILASILSGFFDYNPIEGSQPVEIVQFAKSAGGYAFDICKPSFGNSLAYSLLRKVEMEDRFPDDCKRFKQQRMDMEEMTYHLSK